MIKKNTKIIFEDGEMTADEMVAEARREYFAGELKGYISTEELMEDLNK